MRLLPSKTAFHALLPQLCAGSNLLLANRRVFYNVEQARATEQQKALSSNIPEMFGTGLAAASCGSAITANQHLDHTKQCCLCPYNAATETASSSTPILT